PIPVSVETDGTSRYSQAVEAAVYFCCLEALQNVAKYARASRAVVARSSTNGQLVFRLTDDGRGFDAQATGRRSGLQNMADRLAALGSELRIESEPGAGTSVTGRLPARVVAGAG